MFQDDYILRQIDMLSRFLGKVVFDKDLEFVSLLDEEGGNIGDDLFAYRLRKLLSERKINEGENQSKVNRISKPHWSFMKN